MKVRLALALLLVVFLSSAVMAETRLLRHPDVSADNIVFAYGGDLWIVGRAGGDARRLTSFQGVESYLGGVIVYNLGNAVTTDLEIDGRLAIRQTDRSRSSFVVHLRLSETELLGFETRSFRFTEGTIKMGDPVARRCLDRANSAIRDGVSEVQWRRHRLIEDVLLRAARKLDPRVIRSVKPAHIAKVFRNLARAIRGQGPA